ncbi:MAG: hypothetical protein IPQ00_03330 [Chloracidobacterium sp.]|nr:hypothetical protein [Chloracidobacterium sp.]
MKLFLLFAFLGLWLGAANHTLADIASTFIKTGRREVFLTAAAGSGRQQPGSVPPDSVETLRFFDNAVRSRSCSRDIMVSELAIGVRGLRTSECITP